MSTVLTRHRSSTRGRDRDPYRQPSLFGQVVAPPPLEVAQPAEVATRHELATPGEEVRDLASVEVPTLDAAISALWGELLAGDTAACPVCGDDLEPQRSGAGSAVIGGRCRSCSATLA